MRKTTHYSPIPATTATPLQAALARKGKREVIGAQIATLGFFWEQLRVDPQLRAEAEQAKQPKGLVYLATPYNHPDPAVRQARFERVNKVAASLMQQGLHVISPISQCHPIALAGDLPAGWDYWAAYDRALISCCTALYVLMAPGWRESAGVAAEIAIAHELGLEIRYLEAS